MEAISLYNKSYYIGDSKKPRHHFISGYFRFRRSKFQEKGGFQASPPFLSQSYPQFSLQQPPSSSPPLLPFPAGNNPRRAATKGLSSTPNNRKVCNNTRTRDSSLTPKKAKSYDYPKKENAISSPKKPTPIRLPENGTKVLPFMVVSDRNHSVRAQKQISVDQCDKFSGSVTFTGSPPPSSLPLPTFSLRPKLSCMVEAAGIDSGATDNLRGLLRIL